MEAAAVAAVLVAVALEVMCHTRAVRAAIMVVAGVVEVVRLATLKTGKTALVAALLLVQMRATLEILAVTAGALVALCQAILRVVVEAAKAFMVLGMEALIVGKTAVVVWQTTMEVSAVLTVAVLVSADLAGLQRMVGQVRCVLFGQYQQVFPEHIQAQTH
jgi:xanthosine utilization system XapX-like protein